MLTSDEVLNLNYYKKNELYRLDQRHALSDQTEAPEEGTPFSCMGLAFGISYLFPDG